MSLPTSIEQEILTRAVAAEEARRAELTAKENAEREFQRASRLAVWEKDRDVLIGLLSSLLQVDPANLLPLARPIRHYQEYSKPEATHPPEVRIGTVALRMEGNRNEIYGTRFCALCGDPLWDGWSLSVTCLADIGRCMLDKEHSTSHSWCPDKEAEE